MASHSPRRTDASSSRALLGVVLCGGRSSRMGRDKATLIGPDGKSYLQSAVSRLRDVCDAVAVSGNGDPLAAANASSTVTGRPVSEPVSEPATDKVTDKVIEIVDPVPHLGPAVGVAAAVSHARDAGFGGCLVTPVDTPRLVAANLITLRDRWRAFPADLVVACEIGTNESQPLVAIYPVRFAASLDRLARSDHRSLRAWLRHQRCVAVPMAASSLHNVNRPEDLDDVRD